MITRVVRRQRTKDTNCAFERNRRAVSWPVAMGVVTSAETGELAQGLPTIANRVRSAISLVSKPWRRSSVCGHVEGLLIDGMAAEGL
jgi:hypothetical protein